MKPIPLAIQTLYHDLVQQVHAVTEKVGSIYSRKLKGSEYTYLKQAVGNTRSDIFLGRTDDETVQRRVLLIRQETSRAKERRKIISTLKSAGIPVPATMLGAVLDTLADAGIASRTVVVGTAAYQWDTTGAEERLRCTRRPGRSVSADSEGETIEEILKRADATFAPIPGLDAKALPCSFRSAAGFVVDLVTPQLHRDDPNPLPLPGLAAGATPLQHLRWLIENPIPAAALYGSGVPIHVPTPPRFAIHKLILAQKRTHDRPKRGKDLAQAKALIDVLLESDRWALADAYHDACEQGDRGWRQPIVRSLAELGIDPSIFTI